ncbi:MAG: hypothetical protein CSA70_09535 [Rhodobacterales bacterium]|nr:MAG: hypothetical protein CSA70_09535 [Rhodobacterales bacterium]
MMIRTLAAALLTLALPAPALAFPCSFPTECYEAEACGDAGFAIDVNLAEKRVSTEFGDLTILTVTRTDSLITLFASGSGAAYLMSTTRDTARLSTHSNDGPQVITYLGHCNGAFE